MIEVETRGLNVHYGELRSDCFGDWRPGSPLWSPLMNGPEVEGLGIVLHCDDLVG
jgi:hypothetical protein